MLSPHHRHLQLALELLQDPGGQPAPTRGQPSQRGQVPAARPLFRQRRCMHARDSHEQGDLVTIDEIEGFGSIEARLKHQLDAGVHARVQQAGLAEGMKERQRGERDIALQ